jgi:hypothetical protein
MGRRKRGGPPEYQTPVSRPRPPAGWPLAQQLCVGPGDIKLGDIVSLEGRYYEVVDMSGGVTPGKKVLIFPGGDLATMRKPLVVWRRRDPRTGPRT